MAVAPQQMASSQQEIERMQQVLEKQKQAFQLAPNPSAAVRIDHMQRIKRQLLKYTDEICAALKADFSNRAEEETKFVELVTSLENIKYCSKNVRKWMRPVRRKVGMANMPGTAWVQPQPLGVVGVIVPWNYPIYLAVGPMLSALAAGNRVMVKMSEFTPAAGALFARMMAEVFHEEQVAVFNGEVEVASAFSALPFDHLLYTGSTAVGKLVMRAAADNLTPVTLELGGKSPAIISDRFPMKDAVERLALGKCFNAGQTCVSPDYVLCPQARVDEFVREFTRQVSAMYPTMRDNPDLTAIINQRQFDRLRGYVEEAREKGATVVEINPANEDFSGTRKMPFTLILNATEDMKVTQEEIFGPLFLVVPYNGLDQAIRYVNERPRPLALYYFDWDPRNADKVLEQTHSGGVCINDAMTQVGVDDLPFGGVGPSGMGHYHGYEGFMTFSHAKAVYRKGRLNPAKNILPPYGGKTHDFFLKMLMK